MLTEATAAAGIIIFQSRLAGWTLANGDSQSV